MPSYKLNLYVRKCLIKKCCCLQVLIDWTCCLALLFVLVDQSCFLTLTFFFLVTEFVL